MQNPNLAPYALTSIQRTDLLSFLGNLWRTATQRLTGKREVYPVPYGPFVDTGTLVNKRPSPPAANPRAILPASRDPSPLTAAPAILYAERARASAIQDATRRALARNSVIFTRSGPTITVA